MPDNEKQGSATVTIESGPGLPPVKDETAKRPEKQRMPPVPDMSKRLGPKLMRASARGRRRRASRSRA